MTRGAAQPLPERASRSARRRGRPRGDGSAANPACDLDVQLDWDAGARRLPEATAARVLGAIRDTGGSHAERKRLTAIILKRAVRCESALQYHS